MTDELMNRGTGRDTVDDSVHKFLWRNKNKANKHFLEKDRLINDTFEKESAYLLKRQY